MMRELCCHRDLAVPLRIAIAAAGNLSHARGLDRTSRRAAAVACVV